MITNYMREGRDPGWIELFFDLAYAVLIGRMAHLMFETQHGVFESMAVISFLWIFVMQFLVWMFYTVYMNIYGNNSLWQNIFSFGLMTCLFLIGILMQDIHENASYIASTLGFMCLLISIMYWKSNKWVRENKRYATYKGSALLVLAALSVACIFLESTAVIGVTTVVILLEHLIDEIFLNKVGMAQPDSKHLVERIGVFMILMFGESFITIVNNLTLPIRFHEMLPIGVILIVIYGMFVNYYSHIELTAETKYHRYSQILAFQFLVLSSLALLPVITYHGFYQEVHISQFKWVVIAFLTLFYFGNGMSYNLVKGRSMIGNFLYGVIFPLLFGTIIYKMNNYTAVLVALMIIVLFTAVLITKVNYRPKEVGH
jgi:low temperature requirement protein LtrA